LQAKRRREPTGVSDPGYTQPKRSTAAASASEPIQVFAEAKTFIVDRFR
jgi:hypothetical protein